MSNLRFDEIELSSLGFSLQSHDARKLAQFSPDLIKIPGRNRVTEFGTDFDPDPIRFDGTLSADTEDWPNFTHDRWLDRLDQLKSVIFPLKGYRKLVLSGDQPSRWRWCRYSSMSLEENRPVFRKPFHPVSLQFQPLEPYWRASASPVVVTTVPSTVANGGQADTLPLIEVLFDDPILIQPASIVQPLQLFAVDDLQVNWAGDYTNGPISGGDKLVIDSETLTCRLSQGGTGPLRDVVRFYDYSGPDSVVTGGFPVIKAGGSSVHSIHPAVHSLTFHYDVLFS